MIGVGTSLLFDRRAGKAGPPIPPFNKAMVDAWFMSGLSNADKPGSITGVMGNEMALKNFAFTSESGFGEVSYEGALVFDGVDDYGICNNLPILTDYTVICRRVIESGDDTCVASKSNAIGSGAFIYEIFQSYYKAFSFGAQQEVTVDKSDNVTYQTKTNYNGQSINAGTSTDSDKLFIGRIRETYEGYILKGAIYYFALYNKSLTPEEIETEKERLNEEWLKRSKVTIPEPDVYYDLSLKDNSSPTRNIIDDL